MGMYDFFFLQNTIFRTYELPECCEFELKHDTLLYIFLEIFFWMLFRFWILDFIWTFESIMRTNFLYVYTSVPIYNGCYTELQDNKIFHVTIVLVNTMAIVFVSGVFHVHLIVHITASWNSIIPIVLMCILMDGGFLAIFNHIKNTYIPYILCVDMCWQSNEQFELCV